MGSPGGGRQEKILVVRAGRGGDLIMITPALNALLGAFPAAEFHLLSTGDGRRIMAGYDSRLTRIFLYSRRFPRTLVLQRELLKEFKAEGYTRIYIFETKPHYRRANKAVKFLQDYLKRHTKSDNVKVDGILNQHIWSRGASKPPRKVQIKAVKDSEGKVVASLLK